MVIYSGVTTAKWPQYFWQIHHFILGTRTSLWTGYRLPDSPLCSSGESLWILSGNIEQSVRLRLFFVVRGFSDLNLWRMDAWEASGLISGKYYRRSLLGNIALSCWEVSLSSAIDSSFDIVFLPLFSPCILWWPDSVDWELVDSFWETTTHGNLAGK